MALAASIIASVLSVLQPTSRRTVFRAAPWVAAGLASQIAHPLNAGAAPLANPAAKVPLANPASKVTSKVFIDLRVIKSYDVEVLEDAAVRGRLVIGLFGSEAPQAVNRYLEFIKGTVGQFADRGDGPSYASSSFEKLRPGETIGGGRITGFDQEPFAGVMEYQYRSRLVPLRPILEVNDLSHDRRGLLTKQRLNPGPEFAITLDKAPQLDGSNEVFGQVRDAITTYRSTLTVR
jgi:cyclophilin family peptidyl-prolyl cis-trans isomerase